MTGIDSLSGEHVYLDANVFIYAVEGYAKYSSLCTGLLQSIERMTLHSVTSELTLAEVLVRPLKDAKRAIAKIYEDLIQTQFDLNVVPVTRNVLIEAAKLRAAAGCRLPDAIHIATAQLSASKIFLTADKTLKVPSPLRVVTLDELLAD